MDTLKAYLPLCWFKKNPPDLPRSVDFLKTNLIFFAIVQFFLQANMTDDPLESFYEVTFEALLTLGFVWLVLCLNKTLYAFVQIATALIFAINAMSFFLIPVLVWLTLSEHTASYYFVVILLIWGYGMVTFVLKRALTLNIPAAAITSLVYSCCTYFGAYLLGQVLL